jgi:hypothetical protein
MASVQETLTGNPNNFTEVDIPNPTGRIVITMMSAPAEVWVTSDGTVPVAPSGTQNTGTQRTLSGAVGEQIVVSPAIPGGHMALPIIRLASVGSPVVELEW